MFADELFVWLRERSAGRDRYLFGLAGPPGAGKSTLAAELATALDAPVVPMDGFHLPNATLDERGLRSSKGAPETFAADRFLDCIRALRDPTANVLCPVFDRRRDEPVPDGVVVTPDDVVVIVEGNYLLLDGPPWAEVAELIDAVAYLDVPGPLRRRRLVDRHVSFGRSHPDAVDFVMRSDEANARRVEASRQRADLFVSTVPSPDP
jgi:pantothenate kinase